MNSQHAQTTYLKNYTVPDFLIETVHLHFDIHDAHTTVKSLLRLYRNPLSSCKNTPLVLDGEELTLDSIFIDGKELPQNAYQLTESHLTIANVPEKFLLETCVRIFPKKNTALMGLYQSRSNLCTQCEAEGFRRITFYLDRPDVMAYFTTTITADKDKYPFLLSNGNLIEEKNLDNNRRWVHWEDPSRKPCYLFALVAGDFDVMRDQFVTLSQRTVDLYLYLEKGFLDQGDHAMLALKKSMQWDEEKFGREYDLECYMIVAVSDFNMGAMENKGLNIFNTKYVLAKPKTATDVDYVNIERVIGHEYFHNWSGNRITCRDWFQLTLKEGLTVLRDQLFTEDMTSQGAARIDVVNTLRNQQFPEDAGPMAHAIRPDSYMKIDNFYTVTVYEKGAEVIRMVRTLLSPDIFRKGMDLYFSRYDGQAVRTEEFLSAMSDVSGKDLTQFSRWYHQAGTPVLRVKTNYDAAKETFEVTIKQSCPPTPGELDKLSFHMPFSMGLIGAECKELDLQLQGESALTKGTKVLEIKNSEDVFTFINVKEKPTPSLLRHFSAPVEMQYDYSNEQLAHLLQCDPDAFCRWEAGQRLMVAVISDVAHEMVLGKTPVVDKIFMRSIEKLITHPIKDNNLLARLLLFPSLKYLVTHLKPIDLDVIHAAKSFVEKRVAIELEKAWLALFEKNKVDGAYRYDVSDAGRRRLRNHCLYYLLLTDKDEHIAKAYLQATTANNMTDQLGALYVLNDHAVVQREKALTHFYNTYKNEPLVVNKWLALRAGSALLSTLDDVSTLIHHPAFDRSNPNNVYALLVTFGANTLRFHDKSGVAYQFLATQTLAIDEKNPQVSARVVQPLTQWQQMDEVRGVFMKAQLQRIAESKQLSGNLFEIVSKSLV